MTKIVNFEGKNFSFPDGTSDAEISSALNMEKTDLDEGFMPTEDNKTFYKDSTMIAGGLLLLVILIAIFMLTKISSSKSINFYSLFQKIIVIFAVLFAFWMFRYEVTASHPHQCLDRWKGEVVRC